MGTLTEFMTALGGLGEITAGVLLGVFVVCILRGDLVPAKTVDFLKEERDEWRTVATRQTETIEALMETGRTVEHVMRSLPAPTTTQETPTKGDEVAG